MQQRSKRILVAAAAAVIGQVGIYSSTSRAANLTWDGGGADSNLTTPANWVGDALPLVGDLVRFDAVGNLNLTPSTAGGPVQYLTLAFGNNGAAYANELDAYTIGGTNAITVGSTTAGNYLYNDSEVVQTINAPINMIGGTVWATNNSLVFGGLFNVGNGGTAAGNNVTLNGVRDYTLTGGIAGAGTGSTTGGNLYKGGNGTLYVTADSSAWQGRVFLQGGRTEISHSNALGTGTANIDISGGTSTAVLALKNNISVTRPVWMNGKSAASNYQILNVSGNNSIGLVTGTTSGSHHSFQSDAGKLTIGQYDLAAAVGSSRIINLSGAGDGEVTKFTQQTVTTGTPPVPLRHDVVKTGTGTWTFGGATTGTFGAVTVNAGTLVFDGKSGAQVLGSATVNAGGTLKVVTDDGASGEVGNFSTPTTVTVKAGGTLDASTFSNYSLQPGPADGALGQTMIAGGTVKTGGQLSVYGDNRVYVGDVSTAAAGTMNVVGDLFVTNQYAASGGGLYFNLGNQTTVGGGVNDLISVQGNLIADSSSGPVNVYLGTLGSGLTVGTYRLIETTGGATPNPSDFNLIGFAAGTTRQTAELTSAFNQLNLTVSGAAANLLWKGDGSANVWESAGAANFLNGATPDKYYPFDNATFNDTAVVANRTVNINGAVTLGSATVNTAGTYTFTGTGAIDGGGALTKDGTGTLVVANVGPNTYAGGTTISAGTLQVGNGGADGSIGTGAVVNNGTLVVDKSANLVLSQVVSGSGSLVKRGTADLTLGGANTYTGATTIEAGRLYVTNATGLGDAAAGTTVNAGAQYFATTANLTVNEPLTVSGDGPVAGDGVIRAGGSTTTTLGGPVTLAGNATLKVDGGGATLNLSGAVAGAGVALTVRGDGGGTGRFNGALTLGSGSLVKEGPATWILNGTGNDWTGGTTVNGGTLQVTGEAAIPGTAIAVNTGGTLNVNTTTPVTLAHSLTGGGALTKSNTGVLTLPTANPGFTGTVGFTGGVNNGDNGVIRLESGNALGTAHVSMNGQNDTSQVVELANDITVANTLQTNGRQGALNPLGVFLRNASGNNAWNGNINFAATGGFFGIESVAGKLTVGGNISTTVDNASPRTLNLTGAGDGEVVGVIADGTTATPTKIAIAKAGTGTWKLSGANTYTAATTVSAGTLVLTANAFAPVTTNAGGAVVNGGKLVLDYSGGALPSTIVADLKASHDVSNFRDAAQRYRTTNAADAAKGLGYVDDAAAQQFTIAYTWYGDANLSGDVDADDYVLLDRGFAMGLTGWRNGDFDYSGTVTSDDYLLADVSFAQEAGGVLSPALLAEREAQFGEAYVASLIAAVPEPTGLGLVGLGAVGMLARRRRQAR